LDVVGCSAKHDNLAPLIPKAGKSNFISLPISKTTQLYSILTIITPSCGVDPRTKFPATLLAAEQGHIRAVNTVYAKCKELAYIRDHHGVCKTTGIEDLRKMAGSLQPMQQLTLPLMLGTCAEDIVVFEVGKYKGDDAISLTQMAATTRSQLEHTVAAEETLRAACPLLQASLLKIPIYPLSSRLPPVQRGGKRFRQASIAAASASEGPPPTSPVKKSQRSRMSRAQRVALDKAATR
jgi:hypothetical protein